MSDNHFKKSHKCARVQRNWLEKLTYVKKISKKLYGMNKLNHRTEKSNQDVSYLNVCCVVTVCIAAFLSVFTKLILKEVSVVAFSFYVRNFVAFCNLITKKVACRFARVERVRTSRTFSKVKQMHQFDSIHLIYQA